jgi:AraC family transcriptional regulator of adaptative response/methylated-DNA-[protein]-cysteine methyltransferase
MLAAATRDALCLLEFHDRRMLNKQILQLKKYFTEEIEDGSNHIITETERQLRSYFQGDLKSFDIPMETPGTDFQQLVWKALQDVPYGKTVSYGYLAKALGNEKTMRAVGKANGDNRIAIIIPCHRVIGAKGSLVGYGGKLWRKRWLLKHELQNSLDLRI